MVSTGKGQILLGDLIQALGELPWQDETQAQAIAGCLGYGLTPAILPPPPQDKNKHIDQDDRPKSDPASAPPNATNTPLGQNAEYAAPPPPPLPLSLPDPYLTTRLQALDELVAVTGEAHPPWLDQAVPDSQDIAQVQVNQTSPPRAGLIPDTLARGVFGAALATLRTGFEPDYHRLLFQLARGRIPADLPRLSVPSLYRGCQLFMDFSASMQPWWEDLHDLLRQMRSVLGQNGVRAFKFDSNPQAAKPWLSREASPPWQPQPGQPVLVASDFSLQPGLPSTTAPAGWAEFVQICADAGCPLLILCPWSREYWPGDLGGYPVVIRWHRRTSAAGIRRRVGPVHWVRP